MDRLEKWVGIRIRLVGLFFLVVFVLIVARAFTLQVLDQQDWEHRAERQHQKIIPLAPQRGTIFDRNGEELALSIEVDSIYVDPRKVENPSGEARALAAALSLPYNSLKTKLNSKRSFLWVKRQVSLRESEKVRSLKLAGVNFIKEHKRFYPNSEVGAQVVGFTGLDPKGLEGVELKYDSMLLGQGGYLVTERDALGRGIGAGEAVVQGESRGSDLYLTLDKNLQYIAEKELAAGVKNVHARAGTVVVLDPRSGQVLAMASQPDYNPNAISRYRPSQWRDRALCDTYEPGSTMKIFLLAAALNEGLVRPEETFDCEHGAYRVGGRVIHDHEPFDQLTVAQILKFSSNIGAAKIGALLDRDRYYRYLTDFGFGRPTGIDLPGEVEGLLRSPSQWFDVDLATISFGQGISVTPLQLATAAAAIANGGYLMKPYVVQRAVNGYGETTDLGEPRVERQVVSEQVAHQVRDLMINVTGEGGTGTLAEVPGYRVAGKTGTAQKVDPVTGGYSADKRVASFVGFVPADAPRLVILVVIDEPKEKIYGGLAAAPVFSRIALQSLQYLKVPPTLHENRDHLPPLPPSVLAEAAGSSAHPAEAAGVEEGGRSARMPSCIGMSYRQVLQVMQQTGINMKLIGKGRVVRQSPAAGRPISYRNEVWVRLAPPT